MPRQRAIMNPEHLLPEDAVPFGVCDQRLTRFRESRGFPVTQWPTVVLPSTTVIITCPRPHGYDVICHQRRDNGWWGLPGGRMEIGESILMCAIREAREETGLTIIIERLACVDSDPEHGALVAYPDGNLIHYCNLTFLCHSVGHATLSVSDESLHVGWYDSARLPQPFLPAHLWRLEMGLHAPALSGIPVR